MTLQIEKIFATAPFAVRELTPETMLVNVPPRGGRKPKVLPYVSMHIEAWLMHQNMSYSEAIMFIEQQGGVYPNAEGLVAAMPFLRPELEKLEVKMYGRRAIRPSIDVYGFDIEDMIWNTSGSRLVPFSYIGPKGYSLGYKSFPRGHVHVETANNILIYFKK